MDKSIVDVDQEINRRDKSLATSASKCSGSLVRINSISIDINCLPEEEIESPKHEHFSIRGFVSETKKKDKKKCWPFATVVDDDDDNNINLPPISAPEFRRIPDIANQKSTPGMILADKSDAGTSSYQNIVTGERHHFLTHSIQNIDEDEHGSRGSKDLDYNYPNYKLIGLNPQCTKGHKDVMNNIEHAYVTDKASPIQIETHINNTPADEPENVSSGSDEFAFRALSHKKKPKLRSLSEIINEEKSLTTKQYPKTKSLQIEVDLNNLSLEMEDSSEVEKVAKSPHRKRKLMNLDETDPPIITAKRSKGPVTEATKLINNNSNINIDINKPVEILEMDSERDNRPTLLDSRVSAKAQQQNKARKQNSFDLNIKPRRADTENRKTVETNETGFGEKGNAASCFKNSSFGKQMEAVSDLLKGKRPAEGEKQEASRKNTCIPDLNEAFIEEPSLTDTTINENTDKSALSFRETVREGKRPLVENNTVGASDDIPMDIVELLAKNQHERALDNRKHRIPETNARSGLSGNIGPVQGFLNSSPTTNSNKSHFGWFSPLTPGQHRMPPYSGPNPTVSGPRSRPSEGSDLLWPPRRKNVTFDLNVALNHSIHPFGSEDQTEKDKNAKNTKGEGNRAANKGCSIKSGKIGPGRYKSVPSKDAYSNDTSPTMQLLPLMEQGIVSGSSFKLGPNNFFDRQFAPCHHHPRPNNQQSGRSKDFPTLMLNGVGYSVDGSKQSSSKAAQMPPPPPAINSAGPSSLATQPSRSYPNLEVCTLNRNPADFSIPDAKNECTISVEGLKQKKRNSPKETSGAGGNVEGPKRQKVKKDSSRKESSRK